MQFHMLLTSEIEHPDRIEGVSVMADWGTVSIISPEEGIVTGTHMLVKGDDESIKNWLRPYDGVWLGEGNPLEQRFSVYHIED